MKRILAISNQKGGVGKTTTAINLGSALAMQHQRVLIIDMDPQGNASSGLGHPKNANPRGIADVLLDLVPLSEVILPIQGLNNLFLSPATPDQIGLQCELLNVPNKEQLLRSVLRDPAIDFDYILIDCPPSLNLCTLNALTAAHGVIVPLQAEYFALEGISDLLHTIHQVRKGLNPHLTIAGVIMTMVNMATCLSQEVVNQAQTYFGSGLVFDAMATRNIHLSESPSHGIPIHLYAPESQGAACYNAIAAELLLRSGKTEKIDSQSYCSKERRSIRG